MITYTEPGLLPTNFILNSQSLTNTFKKRVCRLFLFPECAKFNILSDVCPIGVYYVQNYERYACVFWRLMRTLPALM